MHDELKIEILRSTTGCGRSDAQLALEVAGGDEQKAIGLINFIRPRYLIVKSHFSGRGVRSLEGLLLVVLHDGADKPVYTTAVVINYSDEPIYVETGGSLLYWQQLIASHRREQNRYNIESSLELKDYIENEILPETGYVLWTSAREIKELKHLNLPDKEKDKKISEHIRLARESLSNLLESFFKLNLRIDIELELITETQFIELSKGLGLMGSSDSEIEQSVKELEKKVESKKNVTIVLQGYPVIDMTQGVNIKDLQVGDKIAVDITERTPVAEHLGRLLGLRKGNYWLHTWGVIKRLNPVNSGKHHLIVEIARRIYVEAVLNDDAVIRCEKKMQDSDKEEHILESKSPVPTYLTVAGVALVFVFLIRILFMMINR